MSVLRPCPAALAAAAALAALLLAAPAESQAPTVVTIAAADFVFRTDGGGAPNVTIAAGGHVDFAYPSGSSKHNVRFTGAQPTVCGISLGPTGDAAALPSAPSPAVWKPATSRRRARTPSSAICTAR